MDRGVGLICLHYAVEVPKGKPGDRFLAWLGGYFEPHYSVNPFWTIEPGRLPDHPITRGGEPFQVRDEWYYHMRFIEAMEGVTPLLSGMPPRDTLRGWEPGDASKSHHGNPHVYKAVVEEEEPQRVARAFEREDRGRAFGFTGEGLQQLREWAVPMAEAGADEPWRGPLDEELNQLEHVRDRIRAVEATLLLGVPGRVPRAIRGPLRRAAQCAREIPSVLPGI